LPVSLAPHAEYGNLLVLNAGRLSQLEHRYIGKVPTQDLRVGFN
jgi:hypothetical protein